MLYLDQSTFTSLGFTDGVSRALAQTEQNKPWGEFENAFTNRFSEVVILWISFTLSVIEFCFVAVS